MDKNAKFVLRLFLLATFLGSVMFIVLITFAPFPSWWKYTVPEQSPMTWFESVLLSACSFGAFGCAAAVFIKGAKKTPLIWTILGAAFFFLSLDERFAVHERIRDRILAPMNIKLFFFWVDPGDIMLLIFMIFGLVFIPYMIKVFTVSKPGFLMFVFGVVISVLAVIIDSFSFKGLSIEMQRLQQYTEEMFETFAMLLFLNSFFNVFITEINPLSVKQYDGASSID